MPETFNSTSSTRAMTLARARVRVSGSVLQGVQGQDGGLSQADGRLCAERPLPEADARASVARMGHVDEHVPAPMTGSLVHMFSNFLVLLNVYRKLMDPLGSRESGTRCWSTSERSENRSSRHTTIDLVENREEPHKIFSDVMDLVRDSPRIIVDPYVIAADKESRPTPKEQARAVHNAEEARGGGGGHQNILEGIRSTPPSGT